MQQLRLTLTKTGPARYICHLDLHRAWERILRRAGAPGAGHDKFHDLIVTQDYLDALPQAVRNHLVCRVVETLIPVTQKHDIEGLVMGTTG